MADQDLMRSLSEAVSRAVSEAVSHVLVLTNFRRVLHNHDRLFVTKNGAILARGEIIRNEFPNIFDRARKNIIADFVIQFLKEIFIVLF